MASEKNGKRNGDIVVYDVAADKTETQKARYISKFTQKDTLNLCMKVKSITLEMFFLLLAIILVVVMLVEYFGVYRPYLAVEQAEASLTEMENQKNSLDNKLKDYSDVQSQYREYNYENYDITIASRPDVFALLEKVVFPEGKITSLTLNGNTLNINMEEIPQANLSRLNKNLLAEKIVAGVSYSRSGYESEVPMLYFTITLENPEN